MLKFEDLTLAQQEAIVAWENDNDPDGYEFENQDNHRYAIKGNVEQEAAYDELERGGCCGSVNTEIVVGDVTIIYAFNYGH